MLDLNTELSFLLPVAATIILGLAAISISRFERQRRELQEFWNSPTGSALSESPTDADSLSSQIQALQALVEDLQESVGQLADSPTETHLDTDRVLPLENAVRMAKHGATTQDLTKTCGLNIGEAHLLQRLHGNTQESGRNSH